MRKHPFCAEFIPFPFTISHPHKFHINSRHKSPSFRQWMCICKHTHIHTFHYQYNHMVFIYWVCSTKFPLYATKYSIGIAPKKKNKYKSQSIYELNWTKIFTEPSRANIADRIKMIWYTLNWDFNCSNKLHA